MKFADVTDLLPAHIRADLEREGQEHVQMFQEESGLRILKSIDTNEHGRLRHVSVSREDRIPDWDNMKRVKETFFGDAQDAIIVFPRKELYVNHHQFTLHLWQLPTIPGSTGRWELM